MGGPSTIAPIPKSIQSQLGEAECRPFDKKASPPAGRGIPRKGGPWRSQVDGRSGHRFNRRLRVLLFHAGGGVRLCTSNRCWPAPVHADDRRLAPRRKRRCVAPHPHPPWRPLRESILCGRARAGPSICESQGAPIHPPEPPPALPIALFSRSKAASRFASGSKAFGGMPMGFLTSPISTDYSASLLLLGDLSGRASTEGRGRARGVGWARRSTCAQNRRHGPPLPAYWPR